MAWAVFHLGPVAARWLSGAGGADAGSGWGKQSPTVCLSDLDVAVALTGGWSPVSLQAELQTPSRRPRCRDQQRKAQNDLTCLVSHTSATLHSS